MFRIHTSCSFSISAEILFCSLHIMHTHTHTHIQKTVFHFCENLHKILIEWICNVYNFVMVFSVGVGIIYIVAELVFPHLLFCLLIGSLSVSKYQAKLLVFHFLLYSSFSLLSLPIESCNCMRMCIVEWYGVVWYGMVWQRGAHVHYNNRKWDQQVDRYLFFIESSCYCVTALCIVKSS